MPPLVLAAPAVISHICYYIWERGRERNKEKRIKTKRRREIKWMREKKMRKTKMENKRKEKDKRKQ